MATEWKYLEDEGVYGLFVNGKRKAKRDLTKAQKTTYWNAFESDEIYVFQNPFTGIEVELSGVEASVCYFALAWYKRYMAGGGTSLTQVPTQVYDTLKYLLLDLNTGAYYDLID